MQPEEQQNRPRENNRAKHRPKINGVLRRALAEARPVLMHQSCWRQEAQSLCCLMALSRSSTCTKSGCCGTCQETQTDRSTYKYIQINTHAGTHKLSGEKKHAMAIRLMNLSLVSTGCSNCHLLSGAKQRCYALTRNVCSNKSQRPHQGCELHKLSAWRISLLKPNRNLPWC